ncbi:hypothetical protein TNCV_1907231 [Trichonephila clavipes]|nr:hypothetical protein TNCV_1907231 [Trichonephila clavipes]
MVSVLGMGTEPATAARMSSDSIKVKVFEMMTTNRSGSPESGVVWNSLRSRRFLRRVLRELVEDSRIKSLKPNQLVFKHKTGRRAGRVMSTPLGFIRDVTRTGMFHIARPLQVSTEDDVNLVLVT